MRYIFPLLIVLLLTTSCSGGGGVGRPKSSPPASAPAPTWTGTRQLGVSAQVTTALGLATDALGNVFMAGWTMGDLDGNTRTATIDYFITKYDSIGSKQWTKQYGEVNPSMWFSQASISAITTDSAGNFYITGNTNAGLDGNSLVGRPDAFITKFNAAGTKQWTKQIGHTNNQWPGPDTSGYSISVDSSGNSYIAGNTNGPIDGNTYNGAADVFLIKYDSNGAKQWSKQIGSLNADTYLYGVKTDPTGNVYITGRTNGDLNGNTLTGIMDIFLIKYNSAGALQWTKQIGEPGIYSRSDAIAISPSGTIVIAGAHGAALFLKRFNAIGNELWHTDITNVPVSSQSIETTNLSIDSLSNSYLIGNVDGGFDNNSPIGITDFYVAKFDSNGTYVWSKQNGSAVAKTYATAVANDPSGNVFVTGFTDRGLNGNTQKGTRDAFLVKYDRNGNLQ